MSETIEPAQQGLEHAHAASEGHGPHADPGARRVAVLISVLAAALALAEMGEKAAQNEYLTQHVAASDTWAFYQAKNIRADLRRSTAEMLASLPNAAEAVVQKRIEDLRADAARLDDDEKTTGRKQLAEHAKALEAEREAAFERYHKFERVVGGLQICIVLASVAVVTRMLWLALAAGALGGTAALLGLAVNYGVL